MYRHRFILPVILMVFSYAGNTQFSRGTRMAGTSVGSIFFNSGSSDQTVTSIGSTTGKSSNYGISITPSLAWFISSKTAVGFMVNLNPYGDKISFEEGGSTFQKDNSTNFNAGLGGLVRNYFCSEGAILPYGQFSLDGGISTVKKDGFFYGGRTPNIYKETYDGKSSGGFYSNANLTIGATKMMGDYVGLDLFVGYNFSYSKNTLKTTRLRDDGVNGSIDETLVNETTSKYTNHRFIIGLGFQVFLETKKK